MWSNTAICGSEGDSNKLAQSLIQEAIYVLKSLVYISSMNKRHG